MIQDFPLYCCRISGKMSKLQAFGLVDIPDHLSRVGSHLPFCLPCTITSQKVGVKLLFHFDEQFVLYVLDGVLI